MPQRIYSMHFFPCRRKKKAASRNWLVDSQKCFSVDLWGSVIMPYWPIPWWSLVDHRHLNLRIEKEFFFSILGKKKSRAALRWFKQVLCRSFPYCMHYVQLRVLIWGAVQLLIGLWSNISYLIIYKLHWNNWDPERIKWKSNFWINLLIITTMEWDFVN